MLYEEQNRKLKQLDQVFDGIGEAQNQTRAEDFLITCVLNQSPLLSKPFRGGFLIVRTTIDLSDPMRHSETVQLLERPQPSLMGEE